MKFNEKLIELRKREGLSQEELGYKLNVTRQTISKWELGQTTPEMDKLVEIGKIFNVSVDDLIGESEIKNKKNTVIEDRPIKNRSGMKKGGIIVAVVIIVVLIIGGIIVTSVLNFMKSIFGKVNEGVGDFKEQYNQTQNIIENYTEKLDNMENEIENRIEEKEQQSDEIKKDIEKAHEELDMKEFNSTFEFHQGTQYGLWLRELFDEIITNNKKEDKKITLKFLQQETAETEIIKNLKNNLEDMKKYEVSFEYDSEGYIYEIIVEEN